MLSHYVVRLWLHVDWFRLIILILVWYVGL